MVELRTQFGGVVDSDGTRPLFPTRDGSLVSKAGIVATFEQLAMMVSQPIASPLGDRLLGGHSARVTGAQLLAVHGVDVNRIRILARHSGDTILRYVAEAPLASMRMQLGLQPSVPLSAHGPRVGRRVVARLDSLEAAVARLDSGVVVCASVSPSVHVDTGLQFVENLGSLVAHRLRPASTTTICGWDTARGGSGSHAGSCGLESLDGHPWWKICDRCCGTERELSRLAAEDAEVSGSE